MKYNHYSFDLWMTLIKSNPKFKIERARYFHDHFNRGYKPLEEILSIIKRIDNMCNSVNESAGGNIDSIEMYAMVLHELGYPMKDIGEMELISVYHNCQQIMEHYPPVLFDSDTKDVLEKLKNKGAALSILSNTGFIKGVTLKLHLKKLGIYDLFDFMVFSDESGMSKPNQQLFKELIYRSSANQNKILHVGDNPNADKSSRVDCLIINGDTGKTIKSLLL